MEAQDPNAPTDYNGRALVDTAIVMLCLSWFSVSLRGYVRGILVKALQADDWILALAQLNFTVSSSFILRGDHYGLGRHNQSLSQHREIQALKYQALATATYVLNMWLIKLSVAIFLLRIAVERRYRYTLYISMVIVSITSFALFLWNIFQCKPVEAQWDYTILDRHPEAHCVSADAIVSAAYALSAQNIVSDWLYALLPIAMIWKVKMTTEAKVYVSLVLGLGIFASVATIVRIHYLAHLTDTLNILYSGTEPMVWTLIEPGVAIIATSLATMRPLLLALGMRGFRSTGDQSNESHQFSFLRRETKTTRSSEMPGSGREGNIMQDIEQEHTNGGGTLRTPSDAGTLARMTRESRFSQWMSSVSEVRDDDLERTSADSRKSLNGGVRRGKVRRKEVGIMHGGTVLPTPPPGQTWFSPSEHGPARHTSVNLCDPRPRHSQDDDRIGPGVPPRR
ncbi:hypothetical protein DL770_002418 [Monosporascus sp. CRB-9-2]|nr:hypothetical protein DL770_002418 [Monosporascus sp. CRB-9-2]